MYIVKVSHDHVLLVQICNNLMHMWHHVTNHLIISIDKDSNSEMNKNYTSVTPSTCNRQDPLLVILERACLHKQLSTIVKL
jgi:hypothetical protein